jgi:VanZ family protein
LRIFMLVLSLLAFFFVATIIYLANSGSEVIRNFSHTIPYADKFAHSIIFGVFCLILISSLRFRCFSVHRISIYHGFLLLLIFVVIEEFSQIFLETRSFDYLDLMADLIGMSIAAMIAKRISRLPSMQAWKSGLT